MQCDDLDAGSLIEYEGAEQLGDKALQFLQEISDGIRSPKQTPDVEVIPVKKRAGPAAAARDVAKQIDSEMSRAQFAADAHITAITGGLAKSTLR